MSDGPGEATRTRLLAAAEELFANQGYEGTSVRELAAKAGCNLSLISYHFGSKEGLLTELVATKARTVGDRLAALAGQPLDASDAIRAYASFVIEFASANQPFLRMMFRDVIGSQHPALDELRARIRENFRNLERLLAGGLDAGCLRDVDRPVAAVGLAGALLFYFVAYPLTSSLIGPLTPELTERLATTIPEIYLRGVLACAGPLGGKA